MLAMDAVLTGATRDRYCVQLQYLKYYSNKCATRSQLQPSIMETSDVLAVASEFGAVVPTNN